MPNVSAEIAVLQEQNQVTVKTLDRIETKIDDLDKKFAGKWTEKLAIGILMIILGFFINGLLGLFKLPDLSKGTSTSTNPSSSQTTTTTTPTGSTSTTRSSGTSGTSTPGASANANAKPDTATPSSSQASTSNPNGGVTVDLPKAPDK